MEVDAPGHAADARDIHGALCIDAHARLESAHGERDSRIGDRRGERQCQLLVVAKPVYGHDGPVADYQSQRTEQTER